MTEGGIEGFRRTMGSGYTMLGRLGLRAPVLVLRDGRLDPETPEDRWILDTLERELREGRVVGTDHVAVTIKDEDGQMHRSNELVKDERGRWSIRKGDTDG